MFYKDEAEFKTTNGYELNGRWLPRVTRILEVKSKPALDMFMKEMESYSKAEEIKNRSAAEGTMVHNVIEQMALGKQADIPDVIRAGIEAFQEFNESKKIFFHPEFVERTIWSSRHRYAGTVDALATVDGKFGVLDIKTSSGFYPEYNLQTAAYFSALQEFEVKRTLGMNRDVETRWILRVDQKRACRECQATLREKGGRKKIRTPLNKTLSLRKPLCPDDGHDWGVLKGEAQLREFPAVYGDMKAFVAAKILWEWDNNYWLKKIGYAKI